METYIVFTYMLKSICGNSSGHWFLWTSYLGNIHRGAAVLGAIPFCFLTLTSSHLGCIPKLLFYTLPPFYGKKIGKTRHFLSHSGTERFNLNSSPRGCLACCHFFRRVRGSLASLLLLVFCIRSVLGNVAHGCIKLYCKQRIPVAQLEWPSLLGNRASRLWCQRRSENEKIPDSALMSMRRPQRYHRNPLRLSCDHPWRDAWSRGRSLSVANGVHFYTHNSPPQNTHFLPGGWEAADAASRVTGSCAGSSSCNNNRKQEERAEKQLCRSPSFKTLSHPSVTSEEEDEVFVFKDYTSLYRYFPSFRSLLRNTAHHLLCTFIYMPKTANSCNTVNSCLWSKQKNSRFYTSGALI